MTKREQALFSAFLGVLVGFLANLFLVSKADSALGVRLKHVTSKQGVECVWATAWGEAGGLSCNWGGQR